MSSGLREQLFAPELIKSLPKIDAITKLVETLEAVAFQRAADKWGQRCAPDRRSVEPVSCNQGQCSNPIRRGKHFAFLNWINNWRANVCLQNHLARSKSGQRMEASPTALQKTCTMTASGHTASVSPVTH
jgi:hypothetical protein